MNEKRPPEPTPDELLKLLEAQIKLQRMKRIQNGPKRPVLAVVALLLIIAGAALAFLYLQYAATRMPHRDGPGRPSVKYQTSENF